MDILTRCNFKGTYQYIIPPSCKILRYGHHELLGKNALDFVHPDDIQSLKTSFIKAGDNNDSNEINIDTRKHLELIFGFKQ